jgi:hypothetical protein
LEHPGNWTADDCYPDDLFSLGARNGEQTGQRREVVAMVDSDKLDRILNADWDEVHRTFPHLMQYSFQATCPHR